MDVFLIDAFVAIFPSLISALVFIIGILATKKNGNADGWWIAGLILSVIYSFGNITSNYPNYPSVILCAIVVTLFYFPMHRKDNSEKH